jgi:hypothetical protein
MAMVMVKKVKEDLEAKVVKEVKEAGEANKAVNKEALVASRVSVGKEYKAKDNRVPGEASRVDSKEVKEAGVVSRVDSKEDKEVGEVSRAAKEAGEVSRVVIRSTLQLAILPVPSFPTRAVPTKSSALPTHLFLWTPATIPTRKTS